MKSRPRDGGLNQDEQLIRRLKQDLEQLQTQHASLIHQADVLKAAREKLKADTAQFEKPPKTIRSSSD
jgi:uncharacterized protein (DUF3084 family)